MVGADESSDEWHPPYLFVCLVLTIKVYANSREFRNRAFYCNPSQETLFFNNLPFCNNVYTYLLANTP